MGHYSWRYEEFSKKDAKAALSRTEKTLDILRTQQKSVLKALRVYEGDLGEYPSEILRAEAEKLRREIEDEEKRASRWKDILKKMDDGAVFSYERAHSLVDGTAW